MGSIIKRRQNLGNREATVVYSAKHINGENIYADASEGFEYSLAA